MNSSENHIILGNPWSPDMDFWDFRDFFKATTSNTVFYFDFLLESPENHRNHDFSCFSMFLAKNLAKEIE
mgnify:CR=1 FL=1